MWFERLYYHSLFSLSAVSLFVVVVVLLPHSADSQVYHQPRIPSARKCVPLKIGMCLDVPYNTTVYPNLLNHQTQDDAENAINQFHPLVKVKCSEDIKLFLCTVYAPVCTPLEEPIQPCRDLCLSAKNGCESLMIKFGFRWPEQLECKHFPTEGICVGQNRSSSTPSPSRSYSLTNNLECPLTMTASVRSHFALPLSTGILEDCSLPCAADNQVPVFFDKRHRRYLRFWTGGWAVACCVCALFTITTFLIDLARFAYPVRPILYMAICYLVISVVYMIGVVGEDSFACGPYGETPQLLVAQGGEGTACSALAVAHYYFTIASSVWWVVLCLAWFLAANRKWGAESIAGLAPYLHAASWGIPALLSVIVLVTNSIDGDVFTGICSVGNLQPNMLLYYLFLPLTGCIILGLFLLACGICSMMRIRTYIKLQHADVDKNIRKLEKLMFRVSGFAVMYVLPTAASAAVLCYQALQMPLWLDTLYTLRCLHPDRVKFGFSMPRTSCTQRMDVVSTGPELFLVFIKYLCQLIVGITCAVWICSAKTVASYQKAYVRIILRRAAVATDEH